MTRVLGEKNKQKKKHRLIKKHMPSQLNFMARHKYTKRKQDRKNTVTTPQK